MAAGSPVLRSISSDRAGPVCTETHNVKAGYDSSKIDSCQFAFERVNQISNVLQIPNLRCGELHAKRLLNCKHEANVTQTIPLAHIISRHFALGNQVGVVKHVAKNVHQSGMYLARCHDDISPQDFRRICMPSGSEHVRGIDSSCEEANRADRKSVV